MKKHPCNKCILIPCCDSKCELVKTGANFEDFNKTGKCPDCGRKTYKIIVKLKQVFFQCWSCNGSFTAYKTDGIHFQDGRYYYWVKNKIYHYHYTYNRYDQDLNPTGLHNSVYLLKLIKTKL